MKHINKLIGICVVACMFIACETDLNKGIDMRSPQVTIEVDSFTVARGAVVTLQAVITDESGLASYMLQYDKWELSEEVKLDNHPGTYEFSFDVTVPQDAELSWEDTYQKNDGSMYTITQTYHKIPLTLYDTERNKNVVYFYIKANQ